MAPQSASLPYSPWTVQGLPPAPECRPQPSGPAHSREERRRKNGPGLHFAGVVGGSLSGPGAGGGDGRPCLRPQLPARQRPLELCDLVLEAPPVLLAFLRSLYLALALWLKSGFPWWVARTVKNLSAMQETRVWSLGREGPLEKGMATHSSIVAWRIPWTEQPGGLQSMEWQRLRHDQATNTLLMCVSSAVLGSVWSKDPGGPWDPFRGSVRHSLFYLHVCIKTYFLPYTTIKTLSQQIIWYGCLLLDLEENNKHRTQYHLIFFLFQEVILP